MNINSIRNKFDPLTPAVAGVKTNSSFSLFQNIICGVPQGSLLGRLLFNIFLTTLFLFCPTEIASYADDNTSQATGDCLKKLWKKQKKSQTFCLNGSLIIICRKCRQMSFANKYLKEVALLCTTQSKPSCFRYLCSWSTGLKLRTFTCNNVQLRRCRPANARRFKSANYSRQRRCSLRNMSMIP